jgi:hypothetical protein
MRGLARSNGIPVEDGLHDPLMLREGSGQTPGQAELRPAERRQPGAGLGHHLENMVVVSAAVEPCVEIRIVCGIVLLGSGQHPSLGTPMVPFEHCPLLRRHAVCSQPRADALKLGHSLEHGLQVGTRDIGDDGAAVRLSSH